MLDQYITKRNREYAELLERIKSNGESNARDIAFNEETVNGVVDLVKEQIKRLRREYIFEDKYPEEMTEKMHQLAFSIGVDSVTTDLLNSLNQ